MSLRLLSVGALSAGGLVHGATPTYTRNVAAILNERCVECHRSGDIGPMAFTSYADVHPWAKAIRDRVVARTMPPWFADAPPGAFRHDPRLTESESTPFEAGWNIGRPDQIFDIGSGYEVPAQGTSEYQYFRVPTNFKEDRWRRRPRFGLTSAAWFITSSFLCRNPDSRRGPGTRAPIWSARHPAGAR